jgi:tetratricopeptide (TPR) repeat protein
MNKPPESAYKIPPKEGALRDALPKNDAEPLFSPCRISRILWDMKRLLIAVLLLSAAFSVFAAGLPDWFAPLRDAVYEEELKASAVARLGNEVRVAARENLSGYALDAMLARIELYVGKAYEQEGDKNTALACLERGFELAEKSAKLQPNAEAYEVMAATISRLCMFKSRLWVITHGLDSEKYAKKALSLNPRSAGARYIISARWIYAPSLFADVDRGIKEMNQILDGSYDLQKNDRFDVFSSIGYGYVRQKKTDQADVWIHKALEIYPTSKFALELLTGKSKPVEIDI